MGTKLKWSLIVAVVLVALVIAGFATVALAQGPVTVPYSNPWGYGWGLGGMMGRMMGGWGWGGYSYMSNATPISLEQAITRAQQYIAALNNAGLALAEVMEFSNQFYGEVKEKSTDVHAFEFLIDRYTGAIYPEPGPNMMWNTKYSPMAWMHGGFWFSALTAQKSVTPAQAKQNA
jgi:hypothetical protein